jgi:hypothetical protein
MPKVEVHIVKSLAAPSGIGEPGVPPGRNNRIVGDNFLNRYCAFDGLPESMLLGAPLKSFFNSIDPKPTLM